MSRQALGWFAAAMALIGLLKTATPGVATNDRDLPVGPFSLERVVLAHGLADAALASRLARLADVQAPLPGMPPGFEELEVSATLYVTAHSGRAPTGSSSVSPATITLPYPEVADWSDSTVYRVLRHELAHIALGTFMGHTGTPAWLSEGYAEWVAPARPCESLARIGTYFAFRPLDEGVRIDRLGSSPEAYDLYRTFLEFLDVRATNYAVSSGRLLESARAVGASTAVTELSRLSQESASQQWLLDLKERVSQGFPGFGGSQCEPQDG